MCSIRMLPLGARPSFSWASGNRFVDERGQRTLVVLQLSIRRIGHVARPLRHQQDRVQPAHLHLSGKVVLFKNLLDVIVVAVEVDDKVDALRRVKVLRDEDADGRIGVMWVARIEGRSRLKAVVPAGVGKRRARKRHQGQISVVRTLPNG